MSWSLTPQFPACQIVDLSHYFDLKKFVPISVLFKLKNPQNLGISIEIEDRKKSLSRRKLLQNIFDYEGSPIDLKDLSLSKIVYYALTLTQTIHLENDEGKHCRDYPYLNFSSYKECDENFVYNKMSKDYNIMPFWAAKKIDDISDIV